MALRPKATPEALFFPLLHRTRPGYIAQPKNMRCTFLKNKQQYQRDPFRRHRVRNEDAPCRAKENAIRNKQDEKTLDLALQGKG
jgi:hypothetical protein